MFHGSRVIKKKSSPEVILRPLQWLFNGQEIFRISGSKVYGNIICFCIVYKYSAGIVLVWVVLQGCSGDSDAMVKVPPLHTLIREIAGPSKCGPRYSKSPLSEAQPFV